MRALLLSTALLGLASAASATEAPNARAAYVERRGLIEVDAQCRLFTPDIRAALNVGLAQARGALLRSGWSNAQMRELDQTVVAAARARQCGDPRTASAAADARTAFASWAYAGSMAFPGWEREWLARRSSVTGWRLSQAIDAPVAAVFGVREADGVQRLTLAVAVARGQTPPSAARLLMRDPARARAVEVTLPQRMSYGLEAGAPPVTGAFATQSTRSIERLDGGRSQALFVFPDTAFQTLLALDPRESVVIEVQNGRALQRLLVEVGDVAAARGFLTIRR